MNKKNVDRLATFLGLIAGISGVLGANEMLNPKVAGTVGGVATVCLGYLVQRPTNSNS
ncbi:MAG: hypothetical protein ACR2LR_04725 [Hassallia sp.]